MAAFGIHELRNQTEEEFPDAELSDIFGRTRDRVVGAVKDANLGERVGEQASKLRLPEMRASAGRGARASEAPTAAMPPNDEDARLARLERLAELHEKGVLTDEEFAAEKARVLGGSGADVVSGSPPPGLNRKPPDYKSGALPVELGGRDGEYRG